jgi:hypothetical protein
VENRDDQPPDPLLGPASLLQAFCGTRKGNSLRMALDDLRFFAKFSLKQRPEDVETLLFNPSTTKESATRLVVAYRDHMAKANLAPGTIRRRLSTIRQLSRVAEAVGLVGWHIDVPGKSMSHSTTKPEPHRGGVRFREGQSTQTRRDMAIALVARDLRLSRAEVCAIDLEHYRIGRSVGAFEVQRSGERLVMQIGAEATRAMAAWLERRGLKSGPLFTQLDATGKVLHAERLTLADMNPPKTS